ncbi:Venom phosphodiesterase 2 [Frankliniella fusca]|nr:Venom phosphodiesterase 2 [Frankliniella fusca]
MGFKWAEIQKLMPLIGRAAASINPAVSINDSEAKDHDDPFKAMEMDDRLKVYFTDTEFSSLSELEKINCLARLDRYERAEAEGLNKEIIKPDFIRSWETRNKKQKKTNESCSLLQSTEPPRRSSRIRAPLSSVENTCSATQSVPPHRSNALDLDRALLGEQASTLSSSVDTARPTSDDQPASSSSQPANQKQGSSSVNEAMQAEQVRTANFPMPIANFDSIKPTLPTFDVMKILEDKLEPDNLKTCPALRNLKKHGFLTVKAERKLIIRTLTRHLYSLHSRNPSELGTDEKEGMAKSFVKAFPKYCGVHDDSNLPWDAVYCKNANTGWIVNASRSIQKNNRTRKSRKKSETSVPETDNDQDYDSDEVHTLALLVPGREEKAEIESGMRHTFQRRNASRKRNDNISSILSEFPHLKSYDGEMLKLEFRLMRPNATDMCRMFLGLQPKILQLPTQHPFNLGFVDDTMTALVILSQNLPHDIPSRAEKDVHRGVWANPGDIIQAIGTNEDLEVFIAERRTELQRPVQPYIIGVKSVITSKFTKFFIVLDNETVQLGQCQTIKALDHLFMCYYIFNTSYPFGWRNTFHFLSTCFYKVFEDPVPRRRPDAVTPSERELLQLLTNM